MVESKVNSIIGSKEHQLITNILNSWTILFKYRKQSETNPKFRADFLKLLKLGWQKKLINFTTNNENQKTNTESDPEMLSELTQQAMEMWFLINEITDQEAEKLEALLTFFKEDQLASICAEKDKQAPLVQNVLNLLFWQAPLDLSLLIPGQYQRQTDRENQILRKFDPIDWLTRANFEDKERHLTPLDFFSQTALHQVKEELAITKLRMERNSFPAVEQATIPQNKSYQDFFTLFNILKEIILLRLSRYMRLNTNQNSNEKLKAKIEVTLTNHESKLNFS